MENEKILKIIHDLNNILCATSGFTEIMLDREDRDYQKRLLTINKSSLIRMSDILEKARISLLQELDLDTENVEAVK